MYINDAFLSIVPGNEAKAYAALGALADAVKATQPDTWMYLIHTPNLDPGTNIYPPVTSAQVAFVEGYKDFAAYQAHHSSQVMKDFVACMQSASEHRIVLSDRIGSRCSSNICVGVSMRDLVSGSLIDCYS